MKLHEFTMQDQYNTPIETLNKYARDAVDRNDFMFWDEDVAEIRINSVEMEGLPVEMKEGVISYHYVVYGEIITKFQERLTNLEKDCKTILEHPNSNSDLQNMVLSEDVPELIKFARKVDKAFQAPLIDATGMYSDGYRDAIMQLRKEIYG
jgi:hypothetical protein